MQGEKRVRAERGNDGGEVMNSVSVITSHLVTLLLVFLLSVTNAELLYSHRSGGRALRRLRLCVLAGTLTEVVVILIAGREGAWVPVAVRLCCAVGSSAFVLSGVCWPVFVDLHLGRVQRQQRQGLLFLPAAFGVALCWISCWYPLVYGVSSRGIVSHRPGTELLAVIYAYYQICGIGRWIYYYRRGVDMKLFGIWSYAVPIVVGLAAQKLWPTLSLFWAGEAIAMACLLLAMQNEQIYRDELTGLYNRAYLHWIYSRRRSGRLRLTGIMVDLNDFKEINDRCGHAVGDEALVCAAELLRQTAGRGGIVVRYAGDEFVMLIRTGQERIGEQVIRRLQESLARFNAQGDHPYRLSAAAGSALFDSQTMTIDEFLDRMDQRMYADKERYYKKSGREPRERAHHHQSLAPGAAVGK